MGEVITPLLANVTLSAIEERYERWVHHRSKIQARREADGIKAALWARTGDAYDTAMCESFFATMECELLDRRRFTSQADAKMACFSFIEG